LRAALHLITAVISFVMMFLYINDALDFYNKINKRKLLKQQLHYESKLVKQNSLEILKEFERIEDEIKE